MRPLLLAVLLLSGCAPRVYVVYVPEKPEYPLYGEFPSRTKITVSAVPVPCTPKTCPDAIITTDFIRLDHGTADQKEKILAE